MSGELDTELSKGIYVNVSGSWYKAFSEWNEATGGTVTDVDNYNGSGQKWRVHTFTGNGTLTVKKAAKPFRVLAIGGGGNGGNRSGDMFTYCGGGGGGGLTDKAGVSFTVGDHSVTVGAGAGVFTDHGGYTGGASSVNGVSAGGGGGGGAGPAYPPSGNGGPNGSQGVPAKGGGGANQGHSGSRSGGSGVASDITGTSTYYGGGGGGGWGQGGGGGGRGGGGSGGTSGPAYGPHHPGNGANGLGGGGGGACDHYAPGGKGGSGVVIIAYQIG